MTLTAEVTQFMEVLMESLETCPAPSLIPELEDMEITDKSNSISSEFVPLDPVATILSDLGESPEDLEVNFSDPLEDQGSDDDDEDETLAALASLQSVNNLSVSLGDRPLTPPHSPVKKEQGRPLTPLRKEKNSLLKPICTSVKKEVEGPLSPPLSPIKEEDLEENDEDDSSDDSDDEEELEKQLEDLDEILGDLDTQSEEIKEDKNWITPTVENKAQLEKDPVARSKLDLQEEQSQEPIPFYSLRKYRISLEEVRGKAPFTARFSLDDQQDECHMSDIEEEAAKYMRHDTTFECPHCLAKFDNELEVYEHPCSGTKKAERPSDAFRFGCICLVCNTFVFGTGLNNKYFHAKRHHQENEKKGLNGYSTHKFQCPYCPEKFGRALEGLFNAHVNAHTGKALECVSSVCSYRTQTPAFLTEHVISNECVLSEVQSCDDCDYVYYREVDYNHHRSCFHGGAKPPVKGYLHEQKERVKRFSCTLCRFASTKQETYLRHMKLNHPERAETDRVVVDLKISWVMSDRQLLERVAQEMEVEPPSKKVHLIKG